MPVAYQKANQNEGPEEIWSKADGEVSKTKIQAMEVIQNQVRNCCTPKKIKRKLPILNWLPKYNTDDLVGDIVAGLTVGLTVIPQGIAYALIAGLPPNYGLYSSFFGSFLYVLFGSCKDITIGPTAVMSFLTHEYSDGNPDIANLLSFTSGIIIFLFGVFNLGFLIAFISKPVITGFTSAAAITIFTSQLKGLFGIKVSTHGLIDTWVQVVMHIKETRWQDLSLGLICIILLLLMRKLKDIQRFKKNADDTRGQKAMKMTIFLVSVGRNAIVVIVATVISACLDSNQPFTITGDIKPGLPDARVPPFSINNGTTSFIDIMSGVGAGIIILPLIAILENIAIGSAFAQGKTIDATQEMIALGICNIGNSFFQSMPTTGSFSRTAVNSTSGVRTTAGGIVTGVVVVLALAVLTPYFKYIPLSALAAVIICAVIFMIEYEEVLPIWRVRKLDQLVLWISFLVCIFWKLEYGIVAGAVVNLIILLIIEANPKIGIIPHMEGEDGYPPHVVVTPRTGLLYINVDRLRARVTKVGLNEGSGVLPVVLDCCHFCVLDYSASKGMKALCTDFNRRGQPLLFTNASQGVEKSLKALNPDVTIVEREMLIDTLKGLNSKGDIRQTSVNGKVPFIAKHESSHENGLQKAGRAEENSPCSNEEKSLITDSEELRNVTSA